MFEPYVSFHPYTRDILISARERRKRFKISLLLVYMLLSTLFYKNELDKLVVIGLFSTRVLKQFYTTISQHPDDTRDNDSREIDAIISYAISPSPPPFSCCDELQVLKFLYPSGRVENQPSMPRRRKLHTFSTVR